MVTMVIISAGIFCLLVFARQLGRAQTALWLQETAVGLRILSEWTVQKFLPECALIGLASVNIPAIQQWLIDDEYSLMWAIAGSYAVDIGLYICVKHMHITFTIFSISIMVGLTGTMESAAQSDTLVKGERILSTASPYKITDAEIIAMLQQYNGLTAKEVSQYAFIGHSTAKARLKALVDKGLLEKEDDKYKVVQEGI